MFTDRSRVKWIILSYCFIVMVCSRTIEAQVNTEWRWQMPTFCRTLALSFSNSFDLHHSLLLSTLKLFQWCIYCLSLAFKFLLLWSSSSTSFLFKLFSFFSSSQCIWWICIYMFLLDECINRDVYFRVFDYFFVVLTEVTQSILIIWKNGRARKHEAWNSLYFIHFAWKFHVKNTEHSSYIFLSNSHCSFG